MTKRELYNKLKLSEYTLSLKDIHSRSELNKYITNILQNYSIADVYKLLEQQNIYLDYSLIANYTKEHGFSGVKELIINGVNKKYGNSFSRQIGIQNGYFS